LVTFLDRWTRNCSIRTINTAIPLLGLDYLVAVFTFIEELAGISGHGFLLLVITFGTGND